MIVRLIYAAVTCVAAYCTYLDIKWTELGLAKGVAWEGNEILEPLGSHPTAKQLWIFEGVVLAILSAGALSRHYAIEPVCMGGLVTHGIIGHLIGWHKWKNLLGK